MCVCDHRLLFFLFSRVCVRVLITSKYFINMHALLIIFMPVIPAPACLLCTVSGVIKKKEKVTI